jgi:DTW domain-containing protein YfiP
LVIHHRELKRTTNSGRLATEALVNSELRVRGQREQTLDLSDLVGGGYQSLLFFPSEDAVELTTEFIASRRALDPRPFQLIVPDGNWRQASKVASRHPELASLPRVKISDANTATKHLRVEHKAEGMSTLEAIARAFRILESEATGVALLELYQLKLRQTLKGRGELR